MAIDSIEVANQINEAIAQQHKLLQKTTHELKDQLALMRGIAAAQVEQDYGNVLKQIRELRSALDDVDESLEDTTAGFEEAQRAVDQLSQRSDGITALGKTLDKDLGSQFPMLLGAATGFVSGLSSGLGIITHGATASAGAIADLGAGLFSLGRSIISIPFKILGGLVQMANNLPSDTAFAEAREAIRKDFGDLSEDLSKTTFTMYRNLGGELAETGLTAWRIFGNAADRLKAMHEVVEGLGVYAHIFREELRGAFDPQSTERILAYQKGLGISGEQMKGIGSTAIVAGQSLSDVMLDITKTSTGFADAFGMSQKKIARDIAEMNLDVANFGSMSVYEYGRASVYLQKVGVTLKEVMGIFNAYDNFEDAATGAAHLAQAFGANVDALEMMREQDPSKRLDMLRKSMAAAGVDANTLSRQELKLLAQHTGLEESAAKVAFALNNQALSMEEIERQGQRNKKSTMTQEQAMSKLADSIERLVMSGSSSGGFLTQFLQGFERGATRFTDFRKVLKFVRRDLRIFKLLGMETGRAFVNIFPGVRKMVDGLLEFFNPARFKQLRSDLSGVFEGIMSGDVSLETGLNAMTKIFKGFITGPGGAKFMDGLLDFGSTIVKFIAQGIDFGLKYVERAIGGIADFIRNPTAMLEKMRKTAASSTNPIVKMMQPLWEALQKHWRPMVDALKDLWDAVWPRIKAFVARAAPDVMKGILGTILAPAVIQAVIGSVAGSAAGAIGNGLKKLIGAGVEGGVGAASKMLTNSTALKKFGKFFSEKLLTKGLNFVKVAGPVGIAVGIALSVSEGLDMFYDKIDPKFDEVTRKMAAAGTGMIHGLTFGLLPPDLEVRIANALADFADKLFAGLETVFGAKFVENLKEYMSPVIDLWGSLGDIIVSLVTGDDAKFDKAFDEMFDALASTLINGTKFIIMNLVPGLIKLTVKVIGKLGSVLTKAVSMLWDSIGTLVSNGVTAIFGDKLGHGVKLVFDFVKNIYDTLRVFVFETVPGVFSGLVDWFSNLANGIWDAITGEVSWASVWEHFKDIGNAITEPFTDLGPKLVEIWNGWGESFMETWNDISSWFSEKLDSIATKISDVVSYVSDPKQVMSDVMGWGRGIADGLQNGWEYAVGGASDNRLGTSMIDGIMTSAKAELDRQAPKLGDKLGSLTEGWSAKLGDVGKRFTSTWDELKTKASFKDEAKKLASGGLSVEDMGLYQKIKDIDPAEVSKHITKFRDEVVPLFVGGPDSMMGQVRLLAASITDTDEVAIGKVSMLSGIADKIANLGESATRLSKFSATVKPEAVAAGIAAAETIVGTLLTGVDSMASAVTDETTAEVEIASARIVNVVNAIESIVRQVNAVNSALTKVSTGDAVKVKLRNLAKVLGVQNERFEVKSEKVQLYIKLDVSMDAEHVAYAIQKGDWFVLEQGPKGPPHKSA